MVNCTCVVQEGQPPDLRKAAVEKVLNEFAVASFGQEVVLTWVPVAPGSGFTAGKPSSSSVVSFTSSERLSPDRREHLLRELATLWSETTGNTVDEIVAVISDPAQH